MDDPMWEKGRQGFELCANEKQETHLKFDQFIVAFVECLVLWVEEMINKHWDAIESGVAPGCLHGVQIKPLIWEKNIFIYNIFKLFILIILKYKLQPIKQKQKQKQKQNNSCSTPIFILAFLNK